MRQRAAWLYEQLDQVRKLRQAGQGRHAGREPPSPCHHSAAEHSTTRGPSDQLRLWPRPTRHTGSGPSGSSGAIAAWPSVTHTSAEYEFRAGRVERRSKPVATRGLNRNCNRRLKSVFVSAAVAGGRSDPWNEYLESLSNRKGCGRRWLGSLWHGRLRPLR